MEILKVEHLVKQYGKGDNAVLAVNDISFSVEQAVSACSLLSVIPSIMLIITHIIPITIKTIATVPIISPLIIL